jgi:predicted small lipoprotein YifL
MKRYFVFLVLALLLLGCAGGGQQTPQQAPPANNTPNQTNFTPVTPPPKTSPFPMKLTYTMQQGSQSIEMIYWLESEKNCNGRDAVLGLATIKQAGGKGPLAKVTVYLDKGELVASNWQQESDLSFDTATSQSSDIDFMLLMNYIFNAAGKNFMNDPIWNSTEPMLMKEVYTFSAVSNISVTKTGESTSGVSPCTEFSVTVKSSTGSLEQLNVCVTKVTDSNPLPYVVYTKPKEGMGGPEWSLKSVEKVKSGVTEYPQCLPPVVCPKLNVPTADDLNACNQQNGTIQSIKDDKNCVSEYRCMTIQQRAEMQIGNSQATGCGVAQQLVNELVDCWNQQKNANFNRDNSGCVTSVQCQ